MSDDDVEILGMIDTADASETRAGNGAVIDPDHTIRFARAYEDGGFDRVLGEYDEAELEKQLANRGLVNRLLGPVTKSVTEPWQMYPIGLLFGLGFRHRHRGRAAGAGGHQRCGWAALVHNPVSAAPVRRGYEPARHHRRHLHELRLRMGLRQTRAQDLLQHHHHRALHSNRVGHRLDRAARSSRRPLRLDRRLLGHDHRSRPQPHRIPHRRPVHPHLGRRSVVASSPTPAGL